MTVECLLSKVQVEIKAYNPLVSIIVPAFNPGDLFRAVVRSLTEQSYSNIEIIVIDDGSNKENKAIIHRCVESNTKIQLITVESNIGGGRARNIGLSRANGEFIAFCDSDDVWPVDKLSVQIDFMISNEISFSHGDVVKVLGDKQRKIIAQDVIDLKGFLFHTDLYCSSVVLRRQIIGMSKFGTMRARHPFKFWVGILKSGAISYKAPGVFYFYNVRQGSVSSNKIKLIFATIGAYLFYVDDKILSFKGLAYRLIIKPLRTLL